MSHMSMRMARRFHRSPMKRLDSIFDDLKKERTPWIDHWRELSQFILPRLGRWLTTDRNDGGKKNQKIDNEVGTIALRTLTANMFTGTSSPSRRWFRLVPPIPSLEDDWEVKRWLATVEKIMYEIYEKSNFYNSVQALYEEQALFGTGCMIIEPDFDNVIKCRTLTAGQYMLSMDSNGQFHTMAREYEMTLSQMVEAFGVEGPESVSRKVATMYESGSHDQKTRVIRHMIFKKDERIPLDNTRPDHNWSSAYWDPQDNDHGERFLRTNGYHEQPVVSPRWGVTAEDTYGRSPCMEALPTVKATQRLEQDIAMQVELVGQPPTWGPPSMENEPLSTLPGAVNFGSPGTPGQPAMAAVYQINPRIAELQLRLNEHEDRVRKDLYSDLFLLLSQGARPQITAREVEERSSEKLQTLGQVFEQQRTELLNPANNATFGYAFRAGILPDPPDNILGADMKVEYISSLAQAQRLIGTVSIDRFIDFLARMGEATQDPKTPLKLDVQQAADEYASLSGVPPSIIRSDEDVKQILEEQERQEQAALRAQRMEQAAGIAKTASDAQVDNSNMLGRSLEALGVPAQ